MNEYIIKNCPCLFNSYYASGKTVRFECNDGNHDDKLCRDVTDCLLKRIVELCKKEKILYEGDYIKVKQRTLISSDKILKLLDIQEVE